MKTITKIPDWRQPKGMGIRDKLKVLKFWTSLVAQWLRIHLPLQGTRVWFLVQEDSTCRGATKPVRHNYWSPGTETTEPTCRNYWSPRALRPVLHNKRSHRNEKAARCNKKQPLLATTRESLCTAMKTQHRQKKKYWSSYIGRNGRRL